MKFSNIRLVAAFLSIGAIGVIPQSVIAQSSPLSQSVADLKSQIDSVILALGTDKTEQQVRDKVLNVLASSSYSNGLASSTLIAVIDSARTRTDFVTVEALTDYIYDDEEFDCRELDSLIFRISLGIERLPEDRTEFETQDDVEFVLDQCGATDGIVAEALTSVIQAAQLSGDQITVIALTNLSENLGDEILEGSGELGNSAQAATLTSPIAAPPSGTATGGSDY